MVPLHIPARLFRLSGTFCYWNLTAAALALHFLAAAALDARIAGFLQAQQAKGTALFGGAQNEEPLISRFLPPIAPSRAVTLPAAPPPRKVSPRTGDVEAPAAPAAGEMAGTAGRTPATPVNGSPTSAVRSPASPQRQWAEPRKPAMRGATLTQVRPRMRWRNSRKQACDMSVCSQ